jgi:hypothetical protein
VVDDVGWFQSSLHRGHSTLRVGRRFHYPKAAMNRFRDARQADLADMVNDGQGQATLC